MLFCQRYTDYTIWASRVRLFHHDAPYLQLTLNFKRLSAYIKKIARNFQTAISINFHAQKYATIPFYYSMLICKAGSWIEIYQWLVQSFTSQTCLGVCQPAGLLATFLPSGFASLLGLPAVLPDTTGHLFVSWLFLDLHFALLLFLFLLFLLHMPHLLKTKLFKVSLIHFWGCDH